MPVAGLVPTEGGNSNSAFRSASNIGWLARQARNSTATQLTLDADTGRFCSNFACSGIPSENE